MSAIQNQKSHAGNCKYVPPTIFMVQHSACNNYVTSLPKALMRGITDGYTLIDLCMYRHILWYVPPPSSGKSTNLRGIPLPYSL